MNGSTVVMPHFLEVEVHSIIIHSVQNIKKNNNINLTRRCTFLSQDLFLIFSNY